MVGGVKKARRRQRRTNLFTDWETSSPERETVHRDLTAIQKNRRPDVALQAFDWVEVPEAGILDRGRLGPRILELLTRGALSLPLHF